MVVSVLTCTDRVRLGPKGDSKWNDIADSTYLELTVHYKENYV